MDAPADVRAYLGELVDRVRDLLAGRVRGVYALGSLALGGYRPGQSDIDVLVVVDGALEDDTLRSLAERCSHSSLPCPARKLELVLYGAEEAARPRPRPRWQLNLNTGEGMPDHVGLDPDAEPRHWFVLDLALARQSAVALEGPPARELVGAQEPELVRAAQAEAVSWYAHNEPGPAVVAAACRAWHWQETGRFAGKAEALAWAVART